MFLGLGDSTSEPARAGISIESGEDNVELTVVDKGNLEAIRIVAPDGTSADLNGYFKKIDEIGASGKIRYMSGQYKIIGVVDGEETVVTSFEVED